MTVTSKWVALHEVSDYLAKGWREVHIIGGCDDASLMVSPEEPASEPAVFEVSQGGSVRIVSGDGTKWQPIPASKPAKVEEPTDRPMDFNRSPFVREQPEPAAAEMPEAVYLAVNALRQESQYWAQNGVEVASNIFALRADALDTFWRTHAAEPAKEATRAEVDEVAAFNFKDGFECGEIHGRAQAQPAKVRMTEELERVLATAVHGAAAYMNAKMYGHAEEARLAIAAVRAGAAEAGKVRMPKIRKYLKQLSLGSMTRGEFEIAEELLAELDAAEGVK